MAEASLPGLSISPDAVDGLSDALGSSTASPSLEDAHESDGITPASLSGALLDDLGLPVPDLLCVKKLSTGGDEFLSKEPCIGGKCSGSTPGASMTALSDCIKSSTQHDVDRDKQSQILCNVDFALPLKEGLSLPNSVEINSIKETYNILENNTDVFINHVDCAIPESDVSNTVNKSTEVASNDGSDCLSTTGLKGVQSLPETELTSDMLKEKESIGPSGTTTQQSLCTSSEFQSSKCSNSKNLKSSSTCSLLVGCSNAEPDSRCHNSGSVDAKFSQGLCAKVNNLKSNEDKNQGDLEPTRYKENTDSVCVSIPVGATSSETMLTPGEQGNCIVLENAQAEDLLISEITSTKDSSSADKSSFSDIEILDKKLNSMTSSNKDVLNFEDVTIESLNENKSLESVLSLRETEQNSETALNCDDVLSNCDHEETASNVEVLVDTKKCKNENKINAENFTGKNEVIEKCTSEKNNECAGFSDASNLTVSLQVVDRLDKLKNSTVGINRNIQVDCDSKSVDSNSSKQEKVTDTNIATDFCGTKFSAEEPNLEDNLHLTEGNQADSLNCKEVAHIGERIFTDNNSPDIIENKLNSFEFDLELLSNENETIGTPEIMSTDAKDSNVSEDCFSECLIETEKAETSSLCKASIDDTVVMQTVVEGVLQPLDVSNLAGPCSVQSVIETNSSHDNRELFAGVEEPTSLVNSNAAMHVLETSADEADGISGLVINSVVGRFGEVVEEVLDGEETREFADISGTPYLTVDKESDLCTGNPRAKRPRLEVPESELSQPVVIKVKPVKGDFGFWDSEKLRAVIVEKGTILLRLCLTDPLVGQEYDSPSDFVGVMLESEEDGIYGIAGHPGDSGGGHEVFPMSMDGEYQSHYNPYMYHSKTPDGAEEDFVETEEVEESLDYDAATAQPLDWQGEGSSAVTSAIPDHTSPDTQFFYPTLSSQHPVEEEPRDDVACQDTRNLEQQQLKDEGDSLQLYENENAEKERQYEQHKAMLLQHRHALHGYKYGVLGMPITRYAAFTCNKCRKGFGRRKAFEKHLKTHMPLNQCRYCSFKTRNKKQFEIHELRHLKGNPQFECDQCQMKYATSALLRGHRGRHHNIFHCYYCPEVYNSFEGRKKHMREIHGVNIKRKKVRYDPGTEEAEEDQADDKAGADPAEVVAEHVCDVCSKPCRSRALLRIHVAQHLQVDPSQLSENLEPIEGTVAPDDITTEDSEDAKVEYTPPRVYRKRLHNVLDEQQQPPAKVLRLDNNVFSNERYVNDPDINLLARLKPASENAMFHCANCDVSFANPHILLFHVVTVHGFVEYDARRRASGEAMVKDAREEDESKLPVDTPHVEAEANTLTDYYGDLCTTDYGVNARENPPYLESTFVPYRFTCDKCDPPAYFRKSKQLKKHMKVHSTTRKCCACNFSSKKMFIILRHQGACHKKMLRCPYLCLQLFATREELQNHKREVHFGKPSAAVSASVEEDEEEEEEEEEERHDSTD